MATGCGEAAITHNQRRVQDFRHGDVARIVSFNETAETLHSGCANFLSRAHAQEAGRSEEQEHEQHRERCHVLEPGPKRQHRKRLREPERNAAEESAERPAEAADDRRDEAGLIANGVPTLNAVNCVGVSRMPAIAPSAALSAKRQRQHARNRNALQRCRFAIDRAGAHRTPHQRLLEEQRQ